MKLGFIGLGRMGMNMAMRLLQDDHQIVAYNRSKNKIDQIVNEGAEGAPTLEGLIEKLSEPRIIWIMLPSGSVTQEYILRLKDILYPGDIIIEGGNTYYKDDIFRGNFLAEKDIQYMDVGVSGGIWGREKGYCLMIGGNKKTYEYLEP